MIIIWIIVSIIIFSVIILIHELWHFLSARKFWVKVEEFWLWIPPRAKKLFYDKKGTLFSLNWLPLWGFVKLTWEMPNTFLVYYKNNKIYNNVDLEKDIKNNKDIFDKNWDKIWKFEIDEILIKLKENNAPYNLWNKPAYQQAIIILGWVFMNFLLAWIIFSILFFIWVKPIWINDKIKTNLDIKLIPTKEQALKQWILIKNPWVLLSPVKWSIAEKSGINKWDILYEIITCKTKILDYAKCQWWEKNETFKINEPKELINIIKENLWKDILLLLNYETTYKEKNINNYWGKIIKIFIPDEWKILKKTVENITINNNFEYKYSIIDSIKNWWIETKNQALITFKWIGLLAKKIFNPDKPEDRQYALKSLKWPIWIIDFISNSIYAWIIFIIILWAIFSINLWVFNLLPIPALDGWRFIFITINSLIKKIFWKKAISEKTEWLIHIWFFIVLIALSILIAYNDINNIFSK